MGASKVASYSRPEEKEQGRLKISINRRAIPALEVGTCESRIQRVQVPSAHPRRSHWRSLHMYLLKKMLEKVRAGVFIIIPTRYSPDQHPAHFPARTFPRHLQIIQALKVQCWKEADGEAIAVEGIANVLMKEMKRRGH